MARTKLNSGHFSESRTKYRFELVVKKIAGGKPFEMVNGDEIKLKFAAENIANCFKKKDIKLLQAFTKSQTFLFKSNSKEFKLGALYKSPEFGGGGGSGGGAAKTEMTESLQCYYLSLLYNSSRTRLTVDNCSTKDLTDNIKFCHTPLFPTKKAVEDLITEPKIESWTSFGKEGKEENVFMKTANTIYNHKMGKGWKTPVHFHRGSLFMKDIYGAKRRAHEWDKKNDQKGPSSFSDDKWNPGDIWMSNINPDEKYPLGLGELRKSGKMSFDLLKQKVWEYAQKKILLGISLKKLGASPSVSAYNIGETAETREQNDDVNFINFSFGSSPKKTVDDFFSSADIYIKFSNGKLMQLRSTASTKSWQGEVKGATAAAGKIGGGGVNYYCEEFFKKSIGHNTAVSDWKEITSPDKSNMWKLYKKYSSHPKNAKVVNKTLTFKEFTERADDYKNPKGQKAAASFYFSKYMCLLFLDTIDWSNSSALKEFSTQILRYAMSNVDMSTYFIKVE